MRAVASFTQGDMFKDPPPFVYFGNFQKPLSWEGGEYVEESDFARQREFDFLDYPDARYGVITSQTCDLAEEGSPRQPCFQASPVVRMDAASTRNRILPMYLAPLEPPDLPSGQWVADLRIEVPIEKTFLVGKRPIRGFGDEQGYLEFAGLLGRRRDRAAIATELVEAVARTLRRRMANSAGFKNALRDHVRNIRLAIEGGPRLNPTIARVHFVGRDGPVPSDVREKLDTWFVVAYQEADAAGIKLLPNEFHDGTQMSLDVWERTIELNVVPPSSRA